MGALEVGQRGLEQRAGDANDAFAGAAAAAGRKVRFGGFGDVETDHRDVPGIQLEEVGTPVPAGARQWALGRGSGDQTMEVHARNTSER